MEFSSYLCIVIRKERQTNVNMNQLKDGATGKTHAIMRTNIDKKRMASDFNNGVLDVLQ